MPDQVRMTFGPNPLSATAAWRGVTISVENAPNREDHAHWLCYTGVNSGEEIMAINEHAQAEFERVHAETVAIMQNVKQMLRNVEDLAERIHGARCAESPRRANEAKF